MNNVCQLFKLALIASFLSACSGGSKPISSASQGEASSALSQSVSSQSVGVSSSHVSSLSVSSGSASSRAPKCNDESVKEMFSDNNCLICHGATVAGVNGGGLNLESGDIGTVMLGRASVHHGQKGGQSCASELLIDPDDSSNSLLLKLVDPIKKQQLDSTNCIRQPMPQSGLGLDAAALACLTSWITDVVATKTPIDNEPALKPFKKTNAAASLAKAKFILSGLAPTSGEINLLGSSDAEFDPSILKDIIATWENTPEYKRKFRDFINMALQQTMPPGVDYMDQFGKVNTAKSGVDRGMFNANLFEMVSRTAWDIIANDEDFRNIVTTRKWQVTTAILAAYALVEIPRSEAKNTAERELRASVFLEESDYNDWRTIEFTQATEPALYGKSADYPQVLRDVPEGGSLAFRFPRVGYFTTPNFLENWQTNEDNQFRVTVNQTLITALDLSFSPSDSTEHLTENGIPPDHADVNAPCYQCHRLMDPMRLVFQNNMDIQYRSLKEDTSLKPSFSFYGSKQKFKTMDAFANIVAAHPNFANAWTQKMCMLGNSQRCDALDPEFIRISSAFKSSNFNFKLLARDFFSSPIFTGAERVKTHESKEFMVSMARSNHYCRAMEARLENLKKVNGTTGRVRACGGVAAEEIRAFGTISPDAFERGTTDFVQSTRLSVFDAKSINSECAMRAKDIFSNDARKIIDTTTELPKILDQVTQLIIGVPQNHHRYTRVKNGLTRVYDIARKTPECDDNTNPFDSNPPSCGYGMNSNAAYKAVWVAACSSPDLIGVGM